MGLSSEALCRVCSIEPHKYKCPKCFLRYCSLACYKQHKENDCAVQDDIPSGNTQPKPEAAVAANDDLSEDCVKPELLERLGSSADLKALLTNPHLRNVLQEVDEAKDPWSAMKLAMQEPLFTEFADECLSIIDKESLS
ncbi:hypothetical protein CAPTEDRAFT_197103 [Capitella teleta]|uniref:Zinc finger HIT domain-containing protein 3 n=1 Tax=Capitella teleta TaxID=283909 RepID=R7UDI0_CAPTE|nr:hypothetical protein CAPTEDRAFT_197103 [Capitella teleta]|eukprot:ELU04420.1 hypothetical protein CAPTEDRAFT_197103 [Capitella teleta]